MAARQQVLKDPLSYGGRNPHHNVCRVQTDQMHQIHNMTSGESNNGSTIVNYGSGVVIWGIFKSGTTLEL